MLINIKYSISAQLSFSCLPLFTQLAIERNTFAGTSDPEMRDEAIVGYFWDNRSGRLFCIFLFLSFPPHMWLDAHARWRNVVNSL